MDSIIFMLIDENALEAQWEPFLMNSGQGRSF